MDVLHFCAAEGIPFFAYFPLGMGVLIQKKVDLDVAKQFHLSLLSDDGQNTKVKPENMEIAVLDRTIDQDRKFRRCAIEEIRELLSN